MSKHKDMTAVDNKVSIFSLERKVPDSTSKETVEIKETVIEKIVEPGKEYSVIAYVGPGFEKEVSGKIVPLNVMTIREKPDFELRNRWYKIQNGYVSAYRVTGWIKDEKGMWYERENHACPKSTVAMCDGAEYAFDKEGYMITTDRIAEDGHIVY